MRLVRPTCRERLTGKDVDFIASVLAPNRREAWFLTKLLTDEDARDAILDHRALADAVQDSPVWLDISPALYFYLLTRRALRRHGMDDRCLADYLAAVLVEFSRYGRLVSPDAADGVACEYLTDTLKAIAETRDRGVVFALRCHVGNYALFMAGIYPDRIRARHERRGGPGLGYYETVGRCSFGAAGAMERAREFEMAELLQALAEEFHPVCVALHDSAERMMFTEGQPAGVLL